MTRLTCHESDPAAAYTDDNAPRTREPVHAGDRPAPDADGLIAPVSATDRTSVTALVAEGVTVVGAMSTDDMQVEDAPVGAAGATARCALENKRSQRAQRRHVSEGKHAASTLTLHEPSCATFVLESLNTCDCY
jgi:hypothetical protein